MNALIRTVLAVAAAFLVAACFFGLRFACDPTYLRKLIQQDRRREQLQLHERSSFGHDEARETVVRELIAQRCSLREASARMRELDREWLQKLDREWPETAIGIAEMYRWLWSDADYYYRVITELAVALLRDRPEEAASVLRRLEKEHQQLQAGKQTPSATPMERTE